MLDLSVVIPTHNRITYLPDLLASLGRQDYPAGLWELVIVDDGSSDGTPEYLRSVHMPTTLTMRVISQPQSGVATARNNGAHAARGRAVLFLDDDMIAGPSLIGEHARAHLKDPWAVVIGQINTPTSGREPWVAWEDAQLERHYEALRSGRRAPGPRDFYTGNCSVSAALFKKAGGFDTRLPRAEDVDLGYRLQEAEANFHYSGKAESLHLGKHRYDRWLHAARLYGKADVLLAWERGHTDLQREIFRWYSARNRISKTLVRLCNKWPVLEKPSIFLFHLLGRLAYKASARRISQGSYSTIYNLEYWLALIEDIGSQDFWAGVKRQQIAGDSMAASESVEPEVAPQATPKTFPQPLKAELSE